MKGLILFLLLLITINSFGQIVFAPGEFTQWNDRPYNAIEIPGDRYVFSISQEESISQPGAGANGFVMITDANGQVLHKRTFPADSFHVCMVSNIHFINGHLYLNVTMGNDSLGRNIPIWAGIIRMDTMLNVLNKWVYKIGDSSQYIATNQSAVIGNVLYCLYGKGRKPNAGMLLHPVIRAYDLNGVLLKERELDTTFFKYPFPGSDYALIPLDISHSFGGLLLSALAGNIQGTGIGLHSYVFILDSAFNLTKAVPVGCLNSFCKARVDHSLRMVGLSKSTFLGGGVIDTLKGLWISGTFEPRNAVLKYNLSGTVVGFNDHFPVAYTTVSDSPAGKFQMVSNISLFDNSAYYVGHTDVWFYPFFTSDQNQLVVAKCDTNAQMIWTKYIGGDAQYMPTNILATSDHGCLVLAIRYDTAFSSHQYDSYIFKLDANGNFLNVQPLPTKIDRFKVYPNPASDELTITTSLEEPFIFRVLDMNGRVIVDKIFDKNSIKLQIASLTPGLYSYHIQTGKSNLRQTGLWLKK